jgi:hypothetical protein
MGAWEADGSIAQAGQREGESYCAQPAALQQALQDARDARLICHLPAGRYLVSDTLSGIQGVVEWAASPRRWSAACGWRARRSIRFSMTVAGANAGR